MWGAILSDPLPVVALVGHHPTNQLMGREPLRAQPAQKTGLSPPRDAPKRPMRY